MRGFQFIILICFFSFFVSAQRDHRINGAIGKKAMVVTAHPLATRIGVDVLKKGGNAIDAAVAVQFALAVVYPNAGNIGGGGFLVFRKNDLNVYTLDFREKAPLAADEKMFLDKNGNKVADMSVSGALASGVPGTVAGMETAHLRFGKLKWKDLLQPAIDLANNGFKLTKKQAELCNEYQKDFAKYCPGSRFANKMGWKEGDLFVQPELAKTLLRIQEEGANGFYFGEVADSIVSTSQRGGGLITSSDLESYHPVWREPIITYFRDYRVIGMGPPSAGGIGISQLIKMGKDFDFKESGHNTYETAHFMVECEKRVFADRAKYISDPDFYKFPIKKIVNDRYLKSRIADINPQLASKADTIRAGNIDFFEETTHYSIVDENQNAVSCTTTLNGDFGSKVVVNGFGFLMNNEMDDFSTGKNIPNLYGLLGSTPNVIAPGKRMVSSMSPTIVERNGKLVLVVGTPGGATIVTSVYQIILNVLEHDFTMQEAVMAKRFHHQQIPNILYHEAGAFDMKAKMSLDAAGHVLQERKPIGRVDAIRIYPEEGYLEGGADPRGDDAAEGY